MSHPTVVDRKQAFLRQQKQILARGIAPSHRLFDVAEEGGIKKKVLGDVMMKINRDIKRHGREVHSRQLTDHVVEQIDLLYWDAAAPSLDAETDISSDVTGGESTTLNKGDDLTLDRHIAKLPATWDISEDQTTASDVEDVDQDTYINAVSRLQDLSARRLNLQQKLNTYRTLLSLLGPFRKPQENIQPNLVTRDAPLGPELTKTRTLAIRVAGRVSERFGDVQVPSTEEEDVEMAEDDSNAKLHKILSTW